MGKKTVLLALLIVGLVAAAFVGVQRYRVESRNRAVEIVVDYDEIQQLAAATGSTPTDVLKRFKKSGITSVAIAQQTLRDAMDNGDVILTGDQGIEMNPTIAPRIATYLAMVLPHPPQQVDAKHRPSDAVGDYFTLGKTLPLRYLSQLPVGLPETAVNAAHDADVNIIARLVNYPGATPKAINAMMADVSRQGVKTVIFSGDTVLGFKGAIDETADAMKANNLYYGRVEFSKQKGDEELTQKSKDRIVVVHSITQAEMPTLSQPSIVDRFQKGVRERGVRMCYVRMYNSASNDLLGSNADYISDITKSIRKAGYKTEDVHILGEVNAPRAVRALVGVGVAAGIMLLVLSVVEYPGLLLPIALIIVCAGLAAAGETGRKGVALLSAITFPTLGAVRATQKTPDTPTYAPGVLVHALGRMLVAILTAAAGGLLVVGLLSQRDFMLRTNQFLGVKAAHLLPVLLLVGLYAGQVAWKSANWQAQKERFLKAFRDVASNPVLIWQAVGMVVVLAVVGLMVARSGNDSGVGVSSLELRFRSILDKVLYVRPRTKEFLIGYPALLAGIAFALRGRRQYAAPLMVVGSIGLISALNTFCHIHTPLELSILRVINGTVVGVLVGVVFYRIIRGLPGKEC